jgi:small nuclear ribonucleoprotein (snRNP)-like protein
LRSDGECFQHSLPGRNARILLSAAFLTLLHTDKSCLQSSFPVQLPLSLLRTAQGHPMLVELKNGDTYNGRLEQCDSWMNVKLLEVIWTSRDGDRFWKLPEVYIRGNSIKYMTIPNEVLDMVAEEEESKEGALCSSLLKHVA